MNHVTNSNAHWGFFLRQNSTKHPVGGAPCLARRGGFFPKPTCGERLESIPQTPFLALWYLKARPFPRGHCWGFCRGTSPPIALLKSLFAVSHVGTHKKATCRAHRRNAATQRGHPLWAFL